MITSWQLSSTQLGSIRLRSCSLIFPFNLDDYWSTDFDADKDCELEYKINRLSAMEPSPCETVVITQEEQKAFSDCKIKLSNNLQRFCDVRDEAIWQLNEKQP